MGWGKNRFWGPTSNFNGNISATEHDINNRKETRQSTGTALHVPKFGEIWSTNGGERLASFFPTPPPKVCAQDELQTHICDTVRFNHIRQMASMVDADAKSLSSVGEAARRAGSRCPLPCI